MRIDQLAALLAAIGATVIDDQEQKHRNHLESKGWICLGAEAVTGQVHWTNLQRGLGPDGPVTFQRAIWIQRTADAIAERDKQPL